MPQDVEDPTFNPFDDLLDSLDPPVTTEGDAKLHLAGTKGSRTPLTIVTGHQRTQVEPGQYHHPLRSAGSPKGIEDTGVTRPHLNRALTGKLIDFEEDSGSDKLDEEVDGEIVLVHQVAPKDSLAGVALKYGISLADLRRANHLWSSDSIHLRKELYIPVGKTSHAASKVKSCNVVGSPADVISPVNDKLKPSTGTIRRIPAKQLSFFPPPTKPNIPPDTSQCLSIDVADTPQKPYHARYLSTPSTSLNSILTALPIAASTRDTIMARLSFDSPGSSYSDQEQRNREDHELDDVRASRHARSFSQDAIRDDRPNSKLGESTTPNHTTTRYQPSVMQYRNSSAETEGRPFSKHIRTVQLEPSPTMQMPVLKKVPSRSKTISSSDGTTKRTRTMLIDIDFEPPSDEPSR
ncbi:lysm and peptidoglycan-binding domain-containing protein 1 [Moniliophthora roreri MCA 2997]|uniref:Lysm and peptidoglycan-binding domain-containing protein 1 n=2 Tax=Moniliophthora roreri TaxID=221103 RepID=V2XEB2_MONRO|nr:lysm and peptidoglycan-binding domain-containing protein 1 [Moniliophthora roreri MCA 2997]KAI3604609.1 lysm and peptidoglycan-binding domain-containing protein 1 [Moniliophthora roreri]